LAILDFSVFTEYVEMTMYDGPDAAATAAGADQVQVLNNGIDS